MTHLIFRRSTPRVLMASAGHSARRLARPFTRGACQRLHSVLLLLIIVYPLSAYQVDSQLGPTAAMAPNKSSAVAAQMASSGQPPVQPNVMVILTDDQGWGDLSFNGNTNLSTPNIDSIGRLGARFDRFFVCPVCSPTRAEFLTGRYHLRCGVTGVSEGKERLNLDERTIAQQFKAAGYHTACFGKWHNGTQYPYHPNARGFDEFYGYTSGHWGDYFSPPLDHNGRQVQGDGFIADDFTNRAIKFVEANAKQRFFLYLPMPTPHSPMQVPDKYWQRHQNRTYQMTAEGQQQEDVNFTRAAMAMVENIDDNVGRLLRKLDELKIAQNTIVVFFCDNGPNSARWNGGMKGRKGSTDEGGVRSPLFISWPGQIEPGRLATQICGAIDLLPTLADLAGVPLLLSKPIDGISLKPLLTGDRVSLGNRLIFSHWNRQFSVRSQQYRLDHKTQLFDMVSDPGQTKDIAAQQPEVHRELQRQLARWKIEVTSGQSEKLVPFSVGHPDYYESSLPARDGQPQGGVKRSARAPNCSYFTNWIDSMGSMTWLIDVQVAGTFEVYLYYTCPDQAVGTEVELDFQGEKMRAVVDKAHNPPARGAEHDRVPRDSESLVKDFRPLRLGVIKLGGGTGQLTLRAPSMVGEGGIDVSQLTLRRVP